MLFIIKYGMSSVSEKLLICRALIHSIVFCFVFRNTFGATSPPFIDYLKDILRRYPDGGQILKVWSELFCIWQY